MTEARLASGIEASALLARARAEGGFATVLRRGDDERGTLLVLLADRGNPALLVERLLQRDGRYAWESRPAGDAESLRRTIERATDRDPDLWLIELDVPSPERFVAGMTSPD